jgi:antitoxin component of MazEF toxin-antitoxin module
MVQRLVKSGESLTLVLPPQVVNALGLDENSSLRLEVEGQQLTITRIGDKQGGSGRTSVAAAADKSHQRYAEAYKRLAE